MKTFDFQGEISSSKSYYNRALIISHYKKNLQIIGESDSQDVFHLKNALKNLSSDIDVGEGGTTLRFLTFLVSRIPGTWKLSGSPRLFSRPQNELKNILLQLGVSTTFIKDHIIIESNGWISRDLVKVDLSQSSQFASGLVLTV